MATGSSTFKGAILLLVERQICVSVVIESRTGTAWTDHTLCIFNVYVLRPFDILHHIPFVRSEKKVLGTGTIGGGVSIVVCHSPHSAISRNVIGKVSIVESENRRTSFLDSRCASIDNFSIHSNAYFRSIHSLRERPSRPEQWIYG